MKDFGWLTFGWGYKAFAKRWSCSKSKWESRMEIPLASWPLPATPSAAHHRRVIHQVSRSPQVLPWMGWHDISGHLTRSLNKRVGGNSIFTGQRLIHYGSSASANLVQGHALLANENYFMKNPRKTEKPLNCFDCFWLMGQHSGKVDSSEQ